MIEMAVGVGDDVAVGVSDGRMVLVAVAGVGGVGDAGAGAQLPMKMAIRTSEMMRFFMVSLPIRDVILSEAKNLLDFT